MLLSPHFPSSSGGGCSACTGLGAAGDLKAPGLLSSSPCSGPNPRLAVLATRNARCQQGGDGARACFPCSQALSLRQRRARVRLSYAQCPGAGRSLLECLACQRLLLECLSALCGRERPTPGTPALRCSLEGSQLYRWDPEARSTPGRQWSCSMLCRQCAVGSTALLPAYLTAASPSKIRDDGNSVRGLRHQGLLTVKE